MFKVEDYFGKTVDVKNRGKGIIKNVSDKYNTSWLVEIDGNLEHIHDENITIDGKYTKVLP